MFTVEAQRSHLPAERAGVRALDEFERAVGECDQVGRHLTIIKIVLSTVQLVNRKNRLTMDALAEWFGMR